MTETRPEVDALVDPDTRAARVVDFAPTTVSRLIVHQIDLARPAPGGIETCIRGLVRFAPDDVTFAVIGVDAGGEVLGRRLGRWELHTVGERTVWFMPVAHLDPGDQRRLIPHSVRLSAGLVRFRRSLPASAFAQAHRADVAAVVERLLRRPLAYFVHTQENGLTGQTSDSFWRRAAAVHKRIEHGLLRRAATVTVFNPDFAATARAITPRAMFSPTWFDPTLVRYRAQALDPHRVLWVGRVEEPKDPRLALEIFRHLSALDPTTPWSLEMVGTGTLLADLRRELERWPAELAERVVLRGRLTPEEVATAMAEAGVFLMTSHPGYEGFPRVLVEAMAAGLPAVVTDGSDTGAIVCTGTTGYRVDGRNPHDLARAVHQAVGIDRGAVRQAARRFSAPELVARILGAGG